MKLHPERREQVEAEGARIAAAVADKLPRRYVAGREADSGMDLFKQNAQCLHRLAEEATLDLSAYLHVLRYAVDRLQDRVEAMAEQVEAADRRAEAAESALGAAQHQAAEAEKGRERQRIRAIEAETALEDTRRRLAEAEAARDEALDAHGAGTRRAL